MPERFVVIDGTKSEDFIEKQIWSALEKRLFGNRANNTGVSVEKPSAKKKPAKKAPAKPAARKAGKR
jgi:hypothetical protein